MKKIITPLLFSLILFLPVLYKAQIVVDDTPTALQLAQTLAGPNITVTNVVYTGAPLASGIFSTSGNFEFSSGVILSTGDVNNASGPNDDPNTSDNLGAAGTSQMDSLGGANSYDAAILEFDFIVQSPSIQFKYSFGSEEYPEFAPPNQPSFNDVFAFYISGPNITGEENIALIPSSTLPVAIENINAVTNSQYYVDNIGGQEVQFDGYTTTLIAYRDGLVACGTYHLKLVISDIQTSNRNSAVFLQENSLIQENVLDVQTQTINIDGIAIEGCVPASFGFSLLEPSATATEFTYQVGGTATNGVDYQFIDTMVTIPAGQTEASIIINSISDGITEGQEVVYIIFKPDLCSPVDTAFLYIEDAQPIEFTLTGSNLGCYDNQSGEILVNAIGGFPAYTYHVTTNGGNGITSQYTNNPITGLSSGEYSVQVYDIYGCKAEAIVVGGLFDAGTTFLPDGTGVSYTSVIPISGFDAGEQLTDMAQLQQVCATMEHSYLGDLQIRIISPTGQSAILKEFMGGGSCDLGEPFASGPVDGANSNLIDPGVGYDYCWNAFPNYGTMVGESWNYSHTIPASTGGFYTDNYLPAGSYESFDNLSALLGSSLNGNWTIEVSDQFGLDNGYIFEWNISLTSGLPDTLVTLVEPNLIEINGFVTQAQCGGSDGAINLSIVGDFPPYTFAWSNGAVTEDISGVGAGTYSVVVSDGNSCTDSATFNLNNISSINLTSMVTFVTCDGGLNGAIDITPSGGTLPYTFSWSNSAVTEDIAGIGTGLYSVTITDANGCQYTQDIEVTTLPAIQVTMINSSNEVCGAGNGAINISVTGGSGSYSYSWSNGMISENISDLIQGSYSVTVTDANTCTSVNSFDIVNDVSNCSAFCYLNVTNESIINENCGDGTGSIDITVLDAVYPYQVTWGNGATTDDIINLGEGIYTITVIDADQCEVSKNITVGNNAGDLQILTPSIVNENCGNSDGSVDITVSGGILPYTYNWSDASTNEDISNVGAGTYTVSVTDAVGCMINESFLVENNTGTLTVSAIVTNEVCSNQGGNINVTVSGETGAVSYLWSTGSVNEDLYFVSSGDYSITITDGTGCVLNSPIYTVINTAGDLELLTSTVTNEACGNAQGAIDITIIGGVLPYSFLWSNAAVTEDLINLLASEYSAVVTDDNGCQIETGIYTIFNSSGNLSASTNSITNEVCGDSTGQLDILTIGGVAPHTYLWNTGQFTEDITGLTTGIYTITITDATGCMYAHTDQIQSASPGFSSTITLVTNETCGDATGAIDITITGGTLPITYLWNNGAITEDLSALSTGMYSVVITDSNGCELAETATIEGAGIGVTGVNISDEICGDISGSINVTYTGGLSPYSFSWSNGAITEDISGLSAGTYNLTITGSNGCSATESYVVANNTSGLSIISTIVTDENCGDGAGTINITPIGGAWPLTYDWDNGANTEDLLGLSAGNYNLIIEDANGCTTTSSGTVINNSAGFGATINSITDENCGNTSGSVDINVTGGLTPYTFVWNSGQFTEDISGLSAGYYEVTVTDNNSCSTILGATVSNVTGTMTISNEVIGNSSCSSSNGYIDLTITGGTVPYTFAWSNTDVTEDISGLSAGTYTCVVSDNNGCVINYSGAVQLTGGALTTVATISHEECGSSNGEIIVNATGGIAPYTYVWTGATPLVDQTTISNLSAGTYQLTITDAIGCSISESYVIQNGISNLQVSVTNVVDELCGMGQGQVAYAVTGGTAPYTVTLDGVPDTFNQGQFFGLSAATYSLVVVDANGCNDSLNISVANQNSFTTLIEVANDTCSQGVGSVNLTVTGASLPVSYTWSNGAFTEDILGLTSGNYDVTITENSGCSVSYTTFVGDETQGLGITSLTVVDENCGAGDGSIDITTTGGMLPLTFLWSNGAFTEDIINLSAGVYTIQITDNIGCQVELTDTINNNIGGFTLTDTITDENCGDGTGLIDLTVSGGVMPYTFVWNNAAITEDIFGLNTGTYTCQITDNVGCVINYSGDVGGITGGITMSSVIVDETCSESNGSIQIDVFGGANPYAYSWTGASPSTCCSYTLTLQDLFGDGWDGAYITVLINGISLGDYTVSSGSQSNYVIPICSGETIELQYSSGSFEDEHSYTLFDAQGVNLFSDGPSPQTGTAYSGTGSCTQPNNQTTVTDLSIGTYDLTITDGAGCSLTETYSVQGTPSDLVLNLINVANDVCLSSQGTVQSSATGGTGSYSFSLDAQPEFFPGFFLGVPAGNYTLMVVDSDGCQDTMTVTVGNDGDFSLLGIISDATCAVCTEGAVDLSISETISGAPYTYAWSNGAVIEDINGLTPGIYTVVVTSSSGCTQTMDFVVENTVGIVSNNENGRVNIYPNPNDGDFVVTFTDVEGDVSYRVIDIQGKVIENKSFTLNGTTAVKVSITDVERGVYFIEFITNKGTFTTRVIKQ